MNLPQHYVVSVLTALFKKCHDVHNSYSVEKYEKRTWTNIDNGHKLTYTAL
jgi:hypothetical protein